MDRNLRAYVAEFIGTFAVVFLTAGAVCVSHVAAVRWGTPAPGVIVPHPAAVVAVALAAGLSYAVALAITVPLSGGFLNPAVTLALWVFKLLDGTRAAMLIGVQLLAGVAAGMVLLLVLPEDVMLIPARIGTPHLNAAALSLADMGRIWTAAKGIGLEVVFTAVVTFVIFALLLDPRRARADSVTQRLGALWVGLAVIAVTVVGLGLTGAALNPARWFGTVVWEMAVPALRLRNPFEDHVVYWLGPIAGALLAGGVYTSWLMPVEEERPHK